MQDSTMAELVCLKPSNRLSARLTGFTQFLVRIKRMAEVELEMSVAEFHDCLSFFVIPAALELERRVDQRWNRLWMCIDEIGLYAGSTYRIYIVYCSAQKNGGCGAPDGDRRIPQLLELLLIPAAIELKRRDDQHLRWGVDE
ncbi:unnamed protein product [Lactuca saligna]|uniref:Uncharacterized protein n=1 Tax=Lactuca saligna TaxID=75948 RepID=A0AA35YRW3_LACSI|nr:unnamed protein product [Lactuca saligna]